MSIVAIARPGTVDEAADVAVELDVAEAGLLGLDFGWVFFAQVALGDDSWWRNIALSSKLNLASRASMLAVACDDQRVDLDQASVCCP